MDKPATDKSRRSLNSVAFIQRCGLHLRGGLVADGWRAEAEAVVLGLTPRLHPKQQGREEDHHGAGNACGTIAANQRRKRRRSQGKPQPIHAWHNHSAVQTKSKQVRMSTIPRFMCITFILHRYFPNAYTFEHQS